LALLSLNEVQLPGERKIVEKVVTGIVAGKVVERTNPEKAGSAVVETDERVIDRLEINAQYDDNSEVAIY
jgi:hypothetical protein